jgi:plasmid maintenance system antidote protein VapI
MSNVIIAMPMHFSFAHGWQCINLVDMAKRFLTEEGRELLLIKALDKGLKRNADIGKRLGVMPRQFQNILSGDTSLSPKVASKLEEVLGFSLREVRGLTSPNQLRRDRYNVGFPDSLTPAQKATLNYYKKLMQNATQKNVLLDPRLSELLLSPIVNSIPKSLSEVDESVPSVAELSRQLIDQVEMPTLAECVTTSRMLLSSTLEDRNRPYGFHFTYNHFLEIACVIRVNSSEHDGDPQVISYDRQNLKHSHPPGRSIVWGASYVFSNLSVLTPMERWIQAVREGLSTAHSMFLHGFMPIILQVLAYRVDLQMFPITRIKPLGIITLDQRHKGYGRAYSLYTFVVDIFADEERRDPNFIAMLPTNAVDLQLRPQSDLTPKTFERADDEPAFVDEIVMEAIQNPKKPIKNKDRGADFHACFHSGARLF